MMMRLCLQLRQFHAQPMPDLNFVDTFKKPNVELTKPVPYNLRVDTRGREKEKKMNEKVGRVVCPTYVIGIC